MSMNQTLLSVLQRIREVGDEGTTSAEVAEHVGVTEETVRRAVKRLQDEELVMRDGDNRIVPATRRGRRRIEVIERDQKILSALEGYGGDGATLKQLATDASTTESLAYQTAWRLKESGTAKRVGSTRNARWVASQYV